MSLKVIIQNLLLLGIVSFSVLFATDMFIRHWYPIPTKGYGVWAGYPGSVLTLISEPDNFQAIHRYNRFGFRGSDFSIAPKTDFRIVSIGDSYTEGVGVQEQESWPSQLSRKLSGINVEVINLGDAGADTARYAEILSNVALPLKPTDIIVCIIPSDLFYGPYLMPSMKKQTEFYNPFREHRNAFLRPFISIFPGWMYLVDRVRGYWPIEKGMFWNDFNKRRIFNIDIIHRICIQEHVSQSKAIDIIIERMNNISQKVIESSIKGKYNPDAIISDIILPYWDYMDRLQDMQISIHDLTESTQDWLNWYASVSRDFDIRPWLLYFPQAPLVAKGIWGPFKEHIYSKSPKVLGDTSVRDLLKSFCDEFGISFIDSTDILMKHENEQLFLRYDGHPTAQAHELVARIVAERIRPALSRSPLD